MIRSFDSVRPYARMSSGVNARALDYRAGAIRVPGGRRAVAAGGGGGARYLVRAFTPTTRPRRRRRAALQSAKKVLLSAPPAWLWWAPLKFRGAPYLSGAEQGPSLNT